MKKILCLVLALAMVILSGAAVAEGIAASDVKIGLILVGDENEGYSAAHYNGVLKALETLGISESQLTVKWSMPETEVCYDAAVDLADSGCNIVFANSFSHEPYMIQAAGEFPEVEFGHATGYQAALCGLNNVHNHFVNIFEARYVGGVVAGMKLNEMIANGTITEDTAKIGYVGAYPYAEIVSGYTSFFLGVRSVCPSATMVVKYTNDWASFDLEKEAADALIAQGCVLISQHADTTGAPTACEAAGVPCVGYNVDMISVAPNAALTSAAINWGSYYTYAINCVLEGTEIATDWCEGYAEGAVFVTPLNENVVAEGTAEKVDEVIASIIDGSLEVFDTSTFTIGGETLESLIENNADYASYADLVYDGAFHESSIGSAPSFAMLIDGIEELG